MVKTAATIGAGLMGMAGANSRRDWEHEKNKEYLDIQKRNNKELMKLSKEQTH